MGKPGTRRAVISLIAGWISMIGGTASADELLCETVERYKLQNGIDVVLQADHTLPLVAVVSSVHAGSRNDPPGYAQLAHYVEHLLFREGGPFVSAFNLYDGSGATVNARTMPDTTDYQALVPSEQLERALWIEARRLGLGLNAIEEATAETEKQVVLREQSQSRGSEAGLSAIVAVQQALFGPGHPYHSLLGSVETIEAQNLAAARWFFAQYYRLDRVRLIVVGDFEPTATRQLIERHFGGLADSPRPAASSAPSDASADAECRWAKENVVPNKHRVVLRTPLPDEEIEITWPVPAGVDPSTLRPAVGLLTGAVLNRTRELNLSHNVRWELDSRELANLYTLVIGVMPGQEMDRIEPIVWEEQAELAELSLGSATRRAVKRGSELIDRLTSPPLLDRALKLSARKCFDVACTVANDITPEQMAVFSKANAVVFEARNDENAPVKGSVEVSP